MNEKEKQEKTLRIFELCKELTSLLGEKEAIADLKILQNLHPEMFKNMEEVAKLIQEVVSKPEIIINNPTPKSDKDFITARKLNEEKMGEVGVRRDENINKIFHANEKKIGEFYRLQGKIKNNKVQVVGTPTSYTQAQSLDGLVDNNISPAKNIIPQNQTQSQDYNSNDDAAMKELREEAKALEQNKQEENKNTLNRRRKW